MGNLHHAQTVQCLIPEGAEIASGAVLSDTVLLHGRVTLENEVVIGPGVVFAPGGEKRTVLRRGVTIGAGSVIGQGVEIGWRAHVDSGTVVLNSVPPNAIVRGNPAKIVGYTEAIDRTSQAVTWPDILSLTTDNQREKTSFQLGVGAASLHQMPRIMDLRGSLSVLELDASFPFVPKRVFMVFDVSSEELRGEHAHRKCHQFLVCVRGSCRVLLDNGTDRREVALDRPNLGIHMPPMIWGTQYRYTGDALLIVLASHLYDPDDYIRTYDAFLAEVSRRQP